MRRLVGLFMILAFGAFSFGAGSASGAERIIPEARPSAARAGSAALVPDAFLRRWDAFTVFFPSPVGRPAGTPEDSPERFVSLTPAQPGAFTWIDPSTLQFRPADPWPPLSKVRITAGSETFTLATLLDSPSSTVPEQDSVNPGALDAITLVYDRPMDREELSKAVRVEVRNLPGVDSAGAVWLDSKDFRIKEQDRARPDDPAAYVLSLRAPVGDGKLVVVHLKLANDDAGESFKRITFTTETPFRVERVGVFSNIPYNAGRSGEDGSDYSYPSTVETPVGAAGRVLGPDEPLTGGGTRRPGIVVRFSATPAQPDPLAAASFLRVFPQVKNLSVQLFEDKSYLATGDFLPQTLYRVALGDAEIFDGKGRKLERGGPVDFHVRFRAPEASLKWTPSWEVLEARGPKQLPLQGRGHSRVDVRVYPVEPLDRSFWPVQRGGVTTDNNARPPGPGEREAKFIGDDHPTVPVIERQLGALGAPPISAIVDIPLAGKTAAGRFGLDLSRHLEKLSGPDAPGHYLVGMRLVDGPSTRHWKRVQVTDLSVTAMDENSTLRFLVTSLSENRPVADAEITVEGWVSGGDLQTLFSGKTDAKGFWTLQPKSVRNARLGRLIIRKGGDLLILNPSELPDVYAENNWAKAPGGFLNWTLWESGVEKRGPAPEYLGHIFTERPVYRPEEPVHIEGFVREREKGRLNLFRLEKPVLVVDGPGELEWRYPAEITPTGAFYRKWKEADVPTGDYSARLEGVVDDKPWASPQVSFKLEAYRLPQFEVNFQGVEKTPMDAPFNVALTATYYAGGRVEGRPVAWRVTQFPYVWQPKGLEGFLFSSDARFSSNRRFDSTAAVKKESVTDGEGTASIELDPTAEPTAQPRTYVVEATVTGADDQTVTATRRVTALPPFVLGLKIPRFLEKAVSVRPEWVALGVDDKPLPGVEVTARLLHRQWHSVLKAGDFSDGVAKYVTDVVDEKVAEVKLKSGGAPGSFDFALPASGVFLVELEAKDRIGRSQTVTVDFYAGGRSATSWPKPANQVFQVSADKGKYLPGETANFILQSPFQKALALAVVETPTGNRYSFVQVEGGSAFFPLKIETGWVPKLPVHFVLYRGRLAGSGPESGGPIDLGKPTTMASTNWIEIEPVENRVEVTVVHPEKSTPGREIEVKLKLADPQGRPLSGEVALWLVDQAVMSLGTEQRLDPVPDFITTVRSFFRFFDTRSMVVGAIPFADLPGGDMAAKETMKLLDRVTVRKRMETVPYYNPFIPVGPGGETTVKVLLPDNVTNFLVRAKATSGTERFGFAKGTIAVRLPLLVQPALPRFARPGDSFTAAAIGRVVEGDGGPGSAVWKTEGVSTTGSSTMDVSWLPNKPQRIDFPVTVTSAAAAPGSSAPSEIVFTVAVERKADSASDAFEVRLPVREDRRRKVERVLAELGEKRELDLPAVKGGARPGTVSRQVTVSAHPALLRMAAGLNFLMEYPFGCTEQRVSRASAHLALKRFRDVMEMRDAERLTKKSVEDALTWLPTVTDEQGLCSFWPGSKGYVALTAWVYEFVVEAKGAGFRVDEKLKDKMKRALGQALRSDYNAFVDGASWYERAAALRALARDGGLDRAYADELARKTQYLDLESTAKVVSAFAAGGLTEGPNIVPLAEKLRGGVATRLHQGKEIYRGIGDNGWTRQELILPGETRALAEMTSALASVNAGGETLPIMVEGLVTLGKGDGWGSTNANAAALSALAQVMTPPLKDVLPSRVELTGAGGAPSVLEMDGSRPLRSVEDAEGGPARLKLLTSAPVGVRATLSYVPSEDGSREEAESKGFAVTSEALLIGPEGVPPSRVSFSRPAEKLEIKVGDVVEDRVEVVNQTDRWFVAVVVPLAAGMEPLNPNLATAPPEAKPTGEVTLAPSYAAYLDDQVAFYYDSLPKGTYRFSFRTRATTPGSFVRPAPFAELMYDESVRGNGNGALFRIERGEGR